MSWLSKKVKHIRKVVRNPRRLVRSIAHAGADFPSLGMYSRARHHWTIGKKIQGLEHRVMRTYKPRPVASAMPIVLSSPAATSVATSSRRIADMRI